MNKFKSQIITIAAAVVLLAICFAAIGTSGSFPDKNDIGKTAANMSAFTTAADTAESESAETNAAEPEITATVRVLAVGDNLIHKTLYNQAAARADWNGYDFTYAYDNVDDFIRSADLSIINQETLICNDVLEPSDYPHFNSPRALGDHMIDIGFDVFTMANNHCLDQHEEGLSACLDYWDTKPSVTVLGVYRNQEDKDNIRTRNVNGIEFSFLSYTEYTNGLSLPDSSEMIIGDSNDVEGMISDIKKAKELSDVCIVSLHWGVEDSDVIADSQRDTAKRLADAGADVIIGTHPHVLRDIEMIECEDGRKTLCAYSLGNFISAQATPQNLIGGILEFFIDRNGNTFTVEDVTLYPTITHYESHYANDRLYLYSQYSDEIAASHGINSKYRFNCEYIDSILEKNISKKYYSKE